MKKEWKILAGHDWYLEEKIDTQDTRSKRHLKFLCSLERKKAHVQGIFYAISVLNYVHKHCLYWLWLFMLCAGFLMSAAGLKPYCMATQRTGNTRFNSTIRSTQRSWRWHVLRGVAMVRSAVKGRMEETHKGLLLANIDFVRLRWQQLN